MAALSTPQVSAQLEYCVQWGKLRGLVAVGEGELPCGLFSHTAGGEAGKVLRREVLVNREVAIYPISVWFSYKCETGQSNTP